MSGLRRSPRLKTKATHPSDSESGIAFLPDESLISIFSILPVKSRCRAARVCRRWHALIKDKSLWKNVSIIGTIKHRSLAKVLLFVQTYLMDNLETLVLHHVSNKILQHLSQNCPKLRALSLKGKDLKTTDLAHLPPQLLELRLISYQFATNWYCSLTQGLLYQIETLEVFCPHITNNTLGHLATLRTLKSLQLVSCRSSVVDESEGTYTERGFACLVQQLTELRVLRFQQCTQLSDTAFYRIGSSLVKLEELTLHSCCNITDVGLKHLKNLKSLKILDLGGGSPVSPEALMEVVHSLKGLKELWIFDTDNIRQQHIDEIKSSEPGLAVYVKDRWDSLQF
ncbi:F-box/LRR-repeat protein 7-like [Acanthaster planci]|uniref:F-box/LRR-repeat protein 7-like n=1 Tax=Acanthaster planci TaxID=133434 RepID=A0A8B7Y401_ACAPL|nr:F-box/LRR-repeat protein 7-like [Acanthaster planci]XP_022087268.1 F-box/LRR-repeat protein 7-like [Acanthaster planci]XP_022087269.1 F-box/LRR-repeat protein 7-like [Acanthaster planci]XP_022087270.1 F-box/LRR-repeat protein 7-like [Acanthaster planci]